MIKLVIFDWDDVFTQGSIAGYYACYKVALESVGVRINPDEVDRRIKARWGAGGRKQLELLLQEHPERLDVAFDVYQEHVQGDTFVNCLRIIPGTSEFLTEVSKKYILAIATGAYPNVLRDFVFPKFDIPDVFSQIATIYDVDETMYAKPHPYMIEQIVQTQRVRHEESVLVGDAESDMKMARNAGVEPIAVLTGHLNRRQAEDLGVRHIIENVTLLESELLKIN